jgi:hypothetical protein
MHPAREALLQFSRGIHGSSCETLPATMMTARHIAYPRILNAWIDEQKWPLSQLSLCLYGLVSCPCPESGKRTWCRIGAHRGNIRTARTVSIVQILLVASAQVQAAGTVTLGHPLKLLCWFIHPRALLLPLPTSRLGFVTSQGTRT